MSKASGSRSMSLPRAAVRRRSGQVLSHVRPLVDELASERDLVLWDLEFTREAGREMLRVALDRRGGVDADDLARFSDELSRRLDDVDAIPGDTRYVLEVTTPGAERKLRTPDQFDVCVGRPVRLTFKDGREPVSGVLADASPAGVSVRAGTETVAVAYEEISQARLVIPGA